MSDVKVVNAVVDDELHPDRSIHQRPKDMSDEDWAAHCEKHGLRSMTVGEFKKFVTAKRVERRVEEMATGNRHQRRAAKVLAKNGKLTTYAARFPKNAKMHSDK